MSDEKRKTTPAPTFDDVFATMAAASVGDITARVVVPDEPQLDEGATKFALALNILLDDFAYRVEEIKRLEDERRQAREREAEAAALRIEEPMRLLIDSVHDYAIIMLDPSGHVVTWNVGAQRLKGYTADEIIGRHMSTFYPAEAHHTPSDQLRVARDEGRVEDENWRVRKDGSRFWANVVLTAVKDVRGDVVGFAKITRDLTERKRHEEAEVRRKSRELEEENRRMQEESRLKSEFLANMSHELRTPLNAIIGFSEVLLSGSAGPMRSEQSEYLGDILNSSRHLLELINDVLDLAKVGSGKMEFRPEPLDLSQVVGEVRDILRGMTAEKRIRMSTFVDPALGTVMLDAAKLKQVLYNYVSNALKFTDAGGTIAIRLTPQARDRFRIDVEDTGIGIEPAQLSSLFVEFQQLHTGSSRRYGGTGLGLALTKRIVEAQGGEVGVTSVPGKGSVFSAVLPMMTTEFAAPPSRA